LGYRVIQWATGNVGRAALKQLIRNPDLELVGCLVKNPDKHGKDVGELCREGETGVRATTDVAEILSLEADCVCHMPLPSAQAGDDPGADLRDICQLLESGKNVVTTVGYVYPKAYGTEVTAALERACGIGGTSLHGTGANPGWMAEVLPLTLSALSARIDRIYVREVTSFAWYPSHEIIFDMMGLGAAPQESARRSTRFASWLSGLFRESILLLADGLGATVDDVRFETETRLATRPHDIAAGRVEAGTVAALRYRWTAMIGGKPRIEVEAVYKAHDEVAPEWPTTGFVCQVDGKPNFELDLPESWIDSALTATAMHAVHAIPAVCDAAPGIRTFLDLPLIRGRHTFATSGPASSFAR